jgi:RNA polymerase sigma-70 factor (ECF subfamily)
MYYSSDHFSRIYAQYSAILQRYLFRLTKNSEDAADLTQETFMRLYGKTSPPECIQAWLYRTAYCMFVDHWRNGKRKPVAPFELQEESLYAAVTFSPEVLCLESEAKNGILHAMDHLRCRDKTVLLLRGRDGATYREIAMIMGCSEKVVKSVIYRARQRMKKMRKNGQLAHIFG